MADTGLNELDHCIDCGLPLEIAAIKLGFFRKAALLFVCPGCGRARTDGSSEARIDIRDRLTTLDCKLSPATSGDLALNDPIPIHPAPH